MFTLKISFTLLYGPRRSNTRLGIVMSIFLAVDAGGTSTRAVTFDATGRVLGYGRAGGGNPTSAGIAYAVEAIGAAAELALGPAAPDGAVTAVIAMAGEQTAEFRAQLSVQLATLGVRRVDLQPDLLGVFGSGTPRCDGYALIAGTGTVAARVRGGELERVVGGRGWLLGDAGSGYWIGHQVARAVVSALDGQGPPTAMTAPVLQAVGLEEPDPGDRTLVLRQVISALYARRPVQLADFAPIAYAAVDDPVAQLILFTAAQALADLLATVRTPELAGPLVVGGSVMVRGVLTSPTLRSIALPDDEDVLPVTDGLVGAAVLALRGAGIEVREDLFARVQAAVADAAAS